MNRRAHTRLFVCACDNNYVRRRKRCEKERERAGGRERGGGGGGVKQSRLKGK